MSEPDDSGGPPPDRGARERAAIVKAAHRLIGAGSRPASIEDILRLAGVNRRIFYRHFASKDDLVLAMQAQAGESVLRRLRAVTAAAADPSSAVVAWIEEYLGIGWDERRARDGQTFLSSEAGLTADMAGALEETYTRHRRVLADVLDRGRRDGSLHCERPESVAFAIHAVVLRHLETRGRGHLDLPYTDVRDDIVGLFLTALTGTHGPRDAGGRTTLPGHPRPGTHCGRH